VNIKLSPSIYDRNLSAMNFETRRYKRCLGFWDTGSCDSADFH